MTPLPFVRCTRALHAARLQTHAASREKQYATWSQLIRDYCRAHKKFILHVSEDSRSVLFTNVAINRSLPVPSIVSLLDQLVSEGAPTQPKNDGQAPAPLGVVLATGTLSRVRLPCYCRLRRVGGGHKGAVRGVLAEACGVGRDDCPEGAIPASCSPGSVTHPPTPRHS